MNILFGLLMLAASLFFIVVGFTDGVDMHIGFGLIGTGLGFTIFAIDSLKPEGR